MKILIASLGDLLYNIFHINFVSHYKLIMCISNHFYTIWKIDIDVILLITIKNI